MATLKITTTDRDEAGNIKLAAPRPLVDLLPSPADQKEQAAHPPAARGVTFAAGVGGLLLVGVLVVLLQSAPPAPRVTPTVQPTLAPTLAPTAIPSPPHVVAYAAPGGDVLGPIPAGASPVARYGSGWVQVKWDGGAVWVAAQDAPTVDLSALPDLAPEPTATLAPLPTAAPVVVQSPPTTEPQICIRSDYGQRCGPASAMADETRIVTEIATESKERSEAWLATATAEAAR